MPPLHPLLLGFLVALGVGLLIGIDRERQNGDGPAQQAAGLRTFTLASLAGALAMAADGPLLGGRLFALYVIPGLVLMMVAAWAGAFVAGPLRL